MASPLASLRAWRLSSRSARSPSRAGPSRPRGSGRHLAVLGIAFGLVVWLHDPAAASRAPAVWQASTLEVLPLAASRAQHAVEPADVASLRNPGAVELAIRFILGLQPEGTYILTQPGV